MVDVVLWMECYGNWVMVSVLSYNGVFVFLLFS